MIKLPIGIFKSEKLINQQVNRRSIRFLLKDDILVKGKQIEEVLNPYIVDFNPDVRCVFCNYLRRFTEVSMIVDNDVVIFDNIKYYNDSKICFDSVNPDCSKKNYNRNSEEYLRKVLCEEQYNVHIDNRNKKLSGRFTEKWFIDKYGPIQGLIKRKEYQDNCRRSSTKNGFIELYGEEEGTRRWDSYIDKQKIKKTEQWFIDRHGEIEGKKKYSSFKEKQRKMNTFEYLSEKHGDEKAREIINNKKANLYKFISKYGEIEGPKKYKSYCESKTTNLDNMILRHGKEEGKIRFDKFRESSSQTEDNMIERYGEEKGKKKYKEYLEKLQGKCTLDWYIDRYGEKKGKRKYEKFCDSSKYTLEVSIRKYGEEEGTKRYNKFLKDITSNTWYSKISQELFWKINNNFDDRLFKFRENNGEYKLVTDSRFCFLDFFDVSNKLCIEFNGDYWHANPNYYKKDDILPFTTKTASQIWKKDKNRIDFVINNNIKTLIIWESDYKNDPEQTINKCIEFLTI